MKARFLALAALVLGLASCQTEPEGLDVNVGGEQDVTVCVSLPETTRANSAEGAFVNVDLTGNATIRYIMKIYDENNRPSDVRYVKYSDGNTVTFDVRLVPNRDYNFVVWADIVDGEADIDKHYNTTDLTNITLIDWNAMDETRDAFTGVEFIEEYNGASTIDVKLTRPFAKLRVLTTDMEDLAKLNITPTKTVVTYTTEHYASFNALAGEAENKTTTKTHTIENINTYGENGTLFVDYFFANSDVVKFNMSVYDQTPALINKEHVFNTDIAAKRNHLTTIKGNLLTEANEVEVEVVENGAFANENIYIEGDFTLTQDMVIDRPLVVRAGAKAVINLNGHDIINNTKSETFGEGEGIIAYGELDIIGNGTVQGSTMAVWARGNDHAVVNIYGGTFLGCEEGFAKGGRSVVYASSGNVVNIYGGNVKALAADKTSYANKTEGVYAALNVADNNGMINIYGGSFYKQNPAAPGTEPSNWNAAHPNGFLAEDCVSVANGEWFDVIYDPYYYYTKVSTVDGLNAALTDNTVEKIYLAAGNYEGTFHVLHGVKIVGADNAKIIGRVHINSANATFENVMFDRNETDSNKPNNTTSNALQYKAVVMIYGDQTNTIKFDGCKFYNNNGTHKSAITNVACDLIVDNCYFEGYSSSIYSQANLSVTNSTFNYTGGNNVILSINGCGDNGGKVIFKNNTITNHIFALSQFLSTVGFGNGTYHFDIQGNTEGAFDHYFFNTNRVTNKTFADGSITF